MLLLAIALLFAGVHIHAQTIPNPDPGDPVDPPTEEEIAAALAARLAALDAEYTNSFAPWITDPSLSLDGIPFGVSYSSWQADSVTALGTLSSALGSYQQTLRSAATNLSMSAGWPLAFTNNGGINVMIGAEGEKPIYMSTMNFEAADTTSTDALWTNGSSGLNLNGQGTQVAMWDGGDPRTSHQEFTTGGNRVFVLDGTSPRGVQDHPSHGRRNHRGVWGIH